MYIQIENNKLVAFGEYPFIGHTKKIENISYEEYVQEPNKYIFNGSDFILNSNYEKEKEQKEKEKIAMLSMTPLDFIKALESIGIPYTTIKQLCEENEEVDKQLRFCNMVYRGNELLDQFAKQFGITSEQLDLLFISKGN